MMKGIDGVCRVVYVYVGYDIIINCYQGRLNGELDLYTLFVIKIKILLSIS